ncbi:MAG: trans-sulfuration enzyme family protein [Solirubrobacterales bacterium]
MEAGRDNAAGEPVNPALALSTTYRQGGAYEYIRESSPSIEAFEHVVGTLEGGYALAFSSGMAAAASVLDGLRPGARVVAPEVCYLGVRKLLAARGALGALEVAFVDQIDTKATIEAIDGAELVWAETPNNPLLGITDLAPLAAAAHGRGARIAVDATLATPLLQSSLELGADFVVHSATKYLAGHADALLGVVVTADDAERRTLADRREITGAIPGPFETFLGLRGIRTLALRVERAQENAAELARRLSGHPAVSRVRYPGLAADPGHEIAARQMTGFGAVLAFELAAGAEAADLVCANVRGIANATSLGGVETLIERRGRYSEEVHVPASLLRLSVGCEHVDDLWTDLADALAAVDR